MKRFAALIIAVILALPVGILVSSADGKVQDFDDYVGTIYCHWDTIFLDDEVVGGDGTAVSYFLANAGSIEAKCGSLTVRGWALCDEAIEAFGYQIGDNDPVFSPDFFIEPEDAIYDVAAEKDLGFAGRFMITAPVGDLKGTNRIQFCIKNADGIYLMFTDASVSIDIDFTQEGTEAEPTPTPENQGEHEIEPKMVRFNDIFIVDDFFSYASLNNHVNDIDFDEEKLCAVISISGGPDPNMIFPFGSISADDSLNASTGLYDDYISTDDYKAMVIIGRFDYDTVFVDAEKDVGGTFYYTTDINTGYSEMRNKKYYYDRSDDLQYVLIDFSKDSKYWQGYVDDCRFDCFMDTDNDCVYELYFVGFFENAAKASEFIESYKAEGDKIIPTPVPTATPAPTEEAAETPEPEDNKPDDAVDATEKPAENDKKETNGCGSFTAVSLAVFVQAFGALVMLKKKKS